MPLSAVLIPSFTSVVLPFNKVPLSGPHSPCLGLTRTVVLEKTLESPLDSKDIKQVNPKENQPRIFIRRTDAEAEAPILWPPDGKSWLIGKDPDAGKDGRQEEKGMTEDGMVRWHHWLKGWFWAGSGRWWRTGKPVVLQSVGSQRVRHNWATEQQVERESPGDWTCFKGCLVNLGAVEDHKKKTDNYSFS